MLTEVRRRLRCGTQRRQDGDLVGGGQGLVLVVVTSTVVVPVARLGWLARARASATRCC
jgi:hypothetical protein